MQQKPNHQPLFKLSKWVRKWCSCIVLWQVNKGAILHLVSYSSQSMPSGHGINDSEMVNLYEMEKKKSALEQKSSSTPASLFRDGRCTRFSFCVPTSKPCLTSQMEIAMVAPSCFPLAHIIKTNTLASFAEEQSRNK